MLFGEVQGLLDGCGGPALHAVQSTQVFGHVQGGLLIMHVLTGSRQPPPCLPALVHPACLQPFRLPASNPFACLPASIP